MLQAVSTNRLTTWRKPTQRSTATVRAISRPRQLAYPKRVFDTIIHDLNLWSVSPVFAFDTARIWPEVSSGKGLRYGVGGGIRLTLVSHANLTVGYSRNLHRDPKEGSGALFFSISITELLR